MTACRDEAIHECAGKNTHNVAEQLLKHAFPSWHGRKFLDIPCGAGSFLQRLAQGGGQPFGSDLQHMADAALPGDFTPCNMDERLPYDSTFFDGIICLDGLEHIKRPFDFIRECARIVKHEGVLIISTPNISSLRSRWRYFLTGHHNKCKTPLDEENVTPYHHVNMLSYAELRYMLHTEGFTIERVATNRCKMISLLYLVFWPITFLVTHAVYARECPSASARRIGTDVHRQMHTLPVFCGESLIVLARKSAVRMP
jgi:2-polyprenyl-3-methyl-5-hydroxy-6-metoxy-1,4-benzoquinol methylase